MADTSRTTSSALPPNQTTQQSVQIPVSTFDRYKKFMPYIFIVIAIAVAVGYFTGKKYGTGAGWGAGIGTAIGLPILGFLVIAFMFSRSGGFGDM